MKGYSITGQVILRLEKSDLMEAAIRPSADFSYEAWHESVEGTPAIKCDVFETRGKLLAMANDGRYKVWLDLIVDNVILWFPSWFDHWEEASGVWGSVNVAIPQGDMNSILRTGNLFHGVEIVAARLDDNWWVPGSRA